MDTIIFLGTQKSGSSRDAIKAAAELGYITCLLTDNCKQLADRDDYPEVNFMLCCDLDDYNKTRALIDYLKNQSLNICAIISFVDPYCAMAAQLAKDYGVECFTSEAMRLMENKLKTREVLKDTPYNPKYRILTKEKYEKEESTVEAMLPVVVKYVESNGSRDVYFCSTMDAFRKYTEKLFNLYPEGVILVEEFLDGPQVIVEALTINKRVNIIAIIEQEINFLNEHFIITGYNLVVNYSKDFYERLRIATETIIAKYGLENGPCHLEMRLVNGNWKLIEINPRISGAGMNQLLKIGLGFELVEETLKLALKRNVNIEPRHTQNTFAEYVVLDKEGFLEKITGRQEVLNSPGVEYVFVKPRRGRYLTPPVSLGNRYAYVIATGNSKREARNNAKTAASKIIFHLSE